MAVWNFIKRHKVGIICITILIIVIIAALLLVRSMFLSGTEGTLYGNRLDGIEEVLLDTNTLNSIVDEIKKSENVKSASHRLEGKLLNISIDVVNGTTVDVAKSLAAPILSTLSDAEKGFYDIQVIIRSTEEEEATENVEANEDGVGQTTIYPIMGYKHRSTADFVW